MEAAGITEIIIPASTSNLGASFDACGVALALYLKVTVEEEQYAGFHIELAGEGSDLLPHDESNLIVRVARSMGELRGRMINGASLLVDNQIPLGRGLGSSSAAIIAGISVYETLTDDRLTADEVFRYALRFEEHGDNLAPSLLGGMAVVCVVDREGERRLVAIKRAWPEEVRIVLCIPEFEMDTGQMRSVLPREVTLTDAVFNVQRAGLLQALIAERRFELLSEALRDRLHQPHRIPQGPGLAEVLRLNEETRDHPGLLGVAMSGAGSTMIAFATDNFAQIAAEMSYRLATAGMRSRTLEVEVDNRGRVIRSITP